MTIILEQAPLPRLGPDPAESVILLARPLVDSCFEDQAAWPEPDVSSLPEVTYEDWPDNLFAPELDQDPILSLREVNSSEGIFNVTALKIKGVRYLLGRQVEEAAPWGQPDTGPLVLAELNSDGDIVYTSKVWTPDGQAVLIEDPRADQAEDDTTTIGVTAVRRQEGNKAYPGLIILRSPEQLLIEPFPEPRIIDQFGGGEGTTPVSREVGGKGTTAIDKTNIMYRPERMNHTLRVLKVTEDDVAHVVDINFPKNIPWAQYKIGTTTSPVWLNDKEAYIELHGINATVDGQVVDGEVETDNMIYEYAIGTARLLRTVDKAGNVSFSVDNISRAAIITPDSFPALTGGRQVELHPDKRRAEYNCGAISTRDASGELVRRELFPNQGDKRTWYAVVDAKAIIANWDRSYSNTAQTTLGRAG